MNKTYEQRLVAGLVVLGWAEQPRGKYRVFTHPEKECKLFVGSAGALRKGRVATESRSVGDPSNKTMYYLKVLEYGDASAKRDELAEFGL